jgi:hypothetical protein
MVAALKPCMHHLEWSHSPCTDIGCWEGHWYASEQELHQAKVGRRKGQLDTMLRKSIRKMGRKPFAVSTRSINAVKDSAECESSRLRSTASSWEP